LITRENILMNLGVPSDQAEPYLIGLIDELTARCLSVCTPMATSKVFFSPTIDPGTGVMKINGKIFGLNRMVANAMHKSTSIALFIGTGGPSVEALSKSFMKKGEGLEGCITDIIGSEIAEGVAESIHGRLEKLLAKENLKVTNRYSPGYCKWPVSDQQVLFELMGPHNCGVKLTPSSLMIPVKSVSGIIGVGADVVNAGYACAICDAAYCMYRDKKVKHII
jgi:hypothetical protein